MLLFVEFDINADIIDVPQSVIENREHLSRCFIKWLLSPDVKHKYMVNINGYRGLCYRSEAFVEYLNEQVLGASQHKASIVEQYVSRHNKQNLPSVFF